ncbi:MAG: PilZ domain-containing protein [Terracidiphilus sp.]|jgi:hypothetical protein
MADVLFKPEALVPIWVEGSGISALDKMAQRPVLVDVESLGRVMRGQMLQVTTLGATILPDDPFLLWKSVHVKVSFRFRDIVYAFSGMTIVSETRHSFRFEFDGVTRHSLMIMSKNLGDAGLLDAADMEQMLAEEAANAAAAQAAEANAVVPVKKDKISVRLIRHEKPPGGRERRIHHRHDIDVEAKLAIVNSDSNLECSVLELSLGGCRVYTEIPNNIEKGTQVEVQFVECGFPLRMPATIQVKSGVHILGLKYLQMSSRMKERLSSLIWEVAEKEKGH